MISQIIWLKRKSVHCVLIVPADFKPVIYKLLSLWHTKMQLQKLVALDIARLRM